MFAPCRHFLRRQGGREICIMTARRGLVVRAAARGLPAWTCGLRKGDEVLSVNGEPVPDEIDFRFAAAQPRARIAAKRAGKMISLDLVRPDNSELGVAFADTAVARCSNHCVFCFIDQMPPGLRASLYVKDEDANHSFVNGNYVTLGAMTYAQLDHLCGLGLSPLYISVHATDPRVRQRMLGNRHIGIILDQLRFLETNGIRFHTQIVVCPGFNSGAVLTRTIEDLCTFGTGLLSIAVVPVGLTRYHRKALGPVDREEARRICEATARLGEQDLRGSGRRRVFLADELLILAGLPIPPRRYYEDYPQIENGIGLVRMLLEEWAALKRGMTRQPPRGGKRPVLIVTSESAHPYLARVARELPAYVPKLEVRAVAAKNEFFGGGVTVAGLLAARDVVRCARTAGCRGCTVILPSVMFNCSGHTLDGFSARRIGRTLGVPVTVAASLNDMVQSL